MFCLFFLHVLFEADRRLAYSNPQQGQCLDVPSNLTLCSTMGYRKMVSLGHCVLKFENFLTFFLKRMPNFLEQWNLNNIIAEAEVWNKRLGEAKCKFVLLQILTKTFFFNGTFFFENSDAHSRLFLCSVLAPVCVENKAEPVPPCRTICQSVQRSCEGPLHHRYGFTWPDVLSCDRFPTEDQQVCIGPDSLECEFPKPFPITYFENYFFVAISGTTVKLETTTTTSINIETEEATTKKQTSKQEETTTFERIPVGTQRNAPELSTPDPLTHHESICPACVPISSLDHLVQTACSSHVAFRSRVTKISKRVVVGSEAPHFYDVKVAPRRIRVVAEQPQDQLPEDLKQANLRTVLERGGVRSIGVDAPSENCTCTFFGGRRRGRNGLPGGQVLFLVNAIPETMPHSTSNRL